MVQHHADDPWTRVTTAHGLQADEVISAFQKEIRRGNVENAALLAWDQDALSRQSTKGLSDRGAGHPKTLG